MTLIIYVRQQKTDGEFRTKISHLTVKHLVSGHVVQFHTEKVIPVRHTHTHNTLTTSVQRCLVHVIIKLSTKHTSAIKVWKFKRLSFSGYVSRTISLITVVSIWSDSTDLIFLGLCKHRNPVFSCQIGLQVIYDPKSDTKPICGLATGMRTLRPDYIWSDV